MEDIGGKETLPNQKLIEQMTFQLENIVELNFKHKQFSDPKKYKKEDFWDQTTEPEPGKQYTPNIDVYHREKNREYKKNAKDYREKKEYKESKSYKNYDKPKQRGEKRSRGDSDE